MRNPKWAEYVRKHREKAGKTRRDIAKGAGIDPSYVTLIERDGYVPNRLKVEALAVALLRPVGEALLAAGYAPDKLKCPSCGHRMEAEA